jgi:hypothetical protein
MFRGLVTTALLGFAALDPALLPSASVTTDSDLVRYAVTQGGLLFVVLVLLWSYRKDAMGALQIERDRVEILTKLVGDTREANTKSADAVLAQAKSIEGLARAVEKIEERRPPRI